MFSKNNSEIDFLVLENHLKDKLYKLNKEELISDINPKNILSLVTFTMSTIDKYSKNVSGLTKKQMCLNIIYDVIEKSDINIDKK